MTDYEKIQTRLNEMHSRVDFLRGKQEANGEQIADINAELDALPENYDFGNLENPPVVRDEFYFSMLESEAV